MFSLLVAFLLSLASAGKSVVRRENYLHFCGTRPFQWISYYPCNNHSTNSQFGPCGNGGTGVGLRCAFDLQCLGYGICVDGKCCAGTSTTTPTPNPTCGGRETSGGYCKDGSCASGFLCTPENVCCRCASGTSAGPCVNNRCPNGHTCNSAGQCCTVTVHEATAVPNGNPNCVNGRCPSGYSCKGNRCG